MSAAWPGLGHPWASERVLARDKRSDSLPSRVQCSVGCQAVSLTLTVSLSALWCEAVPSGLCRITKLYVILCGCRDQCEDLLVYH